MLKTFRDIRETIGSFISIVAVIIIGCFFFAGISAGSAAVTRQVDDYYESQHLASVRAEYMYVNSPAVSDISAEKGVEKAAGYNTFYTKTQLHGKKLDMVITTLTEGIDEPYVVSGRLPKSGAKEIMVDSLTAKEHGAKVGDILEFDIDTVKKISLVMNVQGTGDQTPQYTIEPGTEHYEFKVSGIYHSPDTIHKVNLRNTAAQPREFITAFVDYGEIALFEPNATVVMMNADGGWDEVLRFDQIPSEINVYNGIKIISDGKANPDTLFGRFSLSSAEQIMGLFANPAAAAGLYMYSLERENFPSAAMFDSINDTIAALAAILPLMFFAVAAAITVISLSKTVENQRMQIGVIQALGVGKGAVYFSYIFYALFACVIGGAVGGTLGITIVPRLLDMLYARQFVMPPTPAHVSPLFLFLGIIIASALACFAAFLSCHRTLKVKPAQAMRPKPPKKTKRILVERWTGLWNKLGFGAKMNLRNMFLHKIRMMLSSVGIIGCLALMIGLMGLKDNMAFSFNRYDASTDYDLTVVIDGAVDLENFEFDAENAKNFEHVTFAPHFTGKFTFKNKTADMTVMALPTKLGADDYKHANADCIKLYTDLDGKKRVVMDDNTFAIPNNLADKLGAKAGDTVTVSGYSLDNRAVEFKIKISHVVYEYFEQKAYCSYAVFENNGVGLYADTAYAKIKKGASLNTAIERLKENERVRDVRSFAETFATLKEKMSTLDYAVVLFVLGAAVLAVAVIYNITATNLKERTREIATLMVLGYKSRETANMLIVENMVITMIGCIVGLPLGYGLLVWLVALTTSFNVFITGFLSWYTAIGCMALTFAFSLIATLMFNMRIKKISMVEALKSVE
ncbi:MAG: FtsX-like permease family protein [Clostridiales bacterium]|nr:FtsX-like permease family protein [Clostridiales bacterium]